VSQASPIELPEDPVVDRLRQRAAASTENVVDLARRLVDEGLRMDAHPGITFRSGPSGRRAALVAGPDVWEVIALVRRLHVEDEEQEVEEAAEWFALSPAEVRTALRYYRDFPQEVDDRIDRNEQEGDRARASWEAQRRTLP